jgi:F-type H+-transporting ATPase subunit b
MHFDWSTLALQIVNFTVLVWLLHRFLYKPVLLLVEARRAEVERHYAEAHAAEAKARDALAALQADRAGIAAEREAALKTAAAHAEDVASGRRVQAERDAAELLDGARKTLAREREHALAEAQQAALDLGTALAERLLADMPEQLRTDAWIERIEQYLSRLPKAELDALVHPHNSGAALTVVTAAPLPAPVVELWRGRLRGSLGNGIALAFDVDPRLVAGAELHFPDAILRFSWQSALAALCAEVETRGDPR